MKQFIVASALILIFCFFLLQWAANETTHMKRGQLVNIVESHTQEARKNGYFTPENIDSIKKDIEDQLYIPQSDIRISATETPKYRTDHFDPNELIHYKIQIPIKKVVAMSSFLGIGEKDNMYWFTLEGDVASEKLVNR